MNATSLTSILIWLPVAGAILIWLLPLSRYATGSLALLFSLAEVGFWIEQAARFDFSQSGLQMEERANWFGDLGVSYHVGVYGFSLWLVGLTVVGMAACTCYGFWVGRDRPRAYFGLMLLLTGATVGVFESQDLLLFYAFFEAMLIPLYILIGVWGGARRLEATIKFVLYTMAGSLLMLAAIVVYGLQAGTFDLVDGPVSGSRWLFLGFMVAFVIKAPLFPFHGWLPDAYREAPPEVAAVLSGVIAKAGLYGMLRIAITKFPDPTSFYRTTVLALAAAALVYGSLLAFRAPDFRGVVAYSSLAQSGLIALGLFAGTDLGFDGAVLQMVAHGLISISLFLVAGAVERTDDHRRVPAARRDGARATRPRDTADDRRRDLARRARIGLVRRRVPHPRRRLPARLVVVGDRRRRDRAGRDVHAPADLGGPARGARLDGFRRVARPPAGRARARRPTGGRTALPLGVAGRNQQPLLHP